jgi:hypothetical protein
VKRRAAPPRGGPIYLSPPPVIDNDDDDDDGGGRGGGEEGRREEAGVRTDGGCNEAVRPVEMSVFRATPLKERGKYFMSRLRWPHAPVPIRGHAVAPEGPCFSSLSSPLPCPSFRSEDTWRVFSNGKRIEAEQKERGYESAVKRRWRP